VLGNTLSDESRRLYDIQIYPETCTNSLFLFPSLSLSSFPSLRINLPEKGVSELLGIPRPLHEPRNNTAGPCSRFLRRRFGFNRAASFAASYATKNPVTLNALYGIYMLRIIYIRKYK